MSSTELYLRLLQYVKPYWRIFLLSVIATAITASTDPLLPILLKPMLDGTFVNRDETVIRLVPVFILLIFFFFIIYFGLFYKLKLLFSINFL